MDEWLGLHEDFPIQGPEDTTAHAERDKAY